MELHYFSKTERILLLGCAIFAALTAYLLLYEDFSFSDKHEGEVVGVVQPIGSYVRQKHFGLVGAFKNIKKQTKAFDQDSIFVGHS
jgi:hypothetical protein